MYSNAEESRYNLFKDVDIVIEADYHYLFNKCHDALREMKLNVIEVNEGLGALEAHKSFTGRNSEKVKVNVQVEKVPNSMNSYIVKVNFKRGFKKDYIVLPRNSKDTNLFINHLIRRPKYTHDK